MNSSRFIPVIASDPRVEEPSKSPGGSNPERRALYDLDGFVAALLAMTAADELHFIPL
jgi:hypothetical protein